MKGGGPSISYFFGGGPVHLDDKFKWPSPGAIAFSLPVSCEPGKRQAAKRDAGGGSARTATLRLPAAGDFARTERSEGEPQEIVPRDRAAGLSVKRKRRKRLVRVGQPCFVPTRPNQQWSIDFVHDRMASGRTLRVLTALRCLHARVPGFGSRHFVAKQARDARSRQGDRGKRMPREDSDG